MRTAHPNGLTATVRDRIRSVDPGQAVADSVLLEQEITNRLDRPRAAMLVVVAFAGSALLLAAVGIYGIIAYSVSQRRRKIGIRMALGADSGRVKAMAFGQVFRLLMLGALAGLPLAFALNRLYTSLLFDVSPNDPVTVGGVIGVSSSVALAAGYLLAARAARVDPAIVLRLD